MLTGSDLLNKVKELGDVSKSDLVRACGYVSNKKDGGDRLNFTAFYEALLEAKGVSLGTTGIGGVGKGGRKLSYVATVQGNGNLLIGKAYTALLDLKPGDEFEIKLGRKQIRLMPVGGSEEDEELYSLSRLSGPTHPKKRQSPIGPGCSRAFLMCDRCPSFLSRVSQLRCGALCRIARLPQQFGLHRPPPSA